MSDDQVRIGGQRMVYLQGRGRELVPADTEATSQSEEFYRRASELLAKRVDEGRAPWMIERGEHYSLPEAMESAPCGGPHAVWLAGCGPRPAQLPLVAGGQPTHVSRADGDAVLLRRTVE